MLETRGESITAEVIALLTELDGTAIIIKKTRAMGPSVIAAEELGKAALKAAKAAEAMNVALLRVKECAELEPAWGDYVVRPPKVRHCTRKAKPHHAKRPRGFTGYQRTTL